MGTKYLYLTEENITKVIDDNFEKNNFNVSSTTKLFNVSHPCMWERCSVIFKETPKRLIENRRIEKAKQLLRDYNLKQIQIMMECGYKNLNTFRSVFKRIEGITPGEYQSKWNT